MDTKAFREAVRDVLVKVAEEDPKLAAELRKKPRKPVKRRNWLDLGSKGNLDETA